MVEPSLYQTWGPPSLVYRGNGSLFPISRRPAIETDHWFPSNAGINNGRSHTFTTPYAFRIHRLNCISSIPQRCPTVRTIQSMVVRMYCSFCGPYFSSSPVLSITNAIVNRFLQKTLFNYAIKVPVFPRTAKYTFTYKTQCLLVNFNSKF